MNSLDLKLKREMQIELKKIQKQLDISQDKRRELISIVYAERDLKEKTIRNLKN